jgi:acetyltransferase-like isoleucine patch superfamily enzyme
MGGIVRRDAAAVNAGIRYGRGRAKFRRVRPLLAAAAAVLRLLPRGLCALCFVLLRHVPTRLGIALRYVLLRRLARRCGDCVAVFEGVYLHHLERISLGDNVSVHPMCYLDGCGGLEIGSDVSIAHATTIMTSEHDYQAESNTRDAPAILSKVSIGNDVWIGCGVRVLAGATIADHAVVGAGAVVTEDVPPCSLAVGVPARVAKRIGRKRA